MIKILACWQLGLSVKSEDVSVAFFVYRVFIAIYNIFCCRVENLFPVVLQKECRHVGRECGGNH